MDGTKSCTALLTLQSTSLDQILDTQKFRFRWLNQGAFFAIALPRNGKSVVDGR